MLAQEDEISEMLKLGGFLDLGKLYILMDIVQVTSYGVSNYGRKGG